MAKPETNENNQKWSTCEELLLACAVHRHGVDSWDSVAAEIHKQKNSSSHTLTSSDCRHKYTDLKRRFSPEGGETVSEISWWLEELRKLRVDELRREVERYDLSISSLQSKVKRLEDEREKEEAEIKGTESSDLVKLAQTGPVIEPNREIEKSAEEKMNRIGGDETEEKPVREDSGRGSCESVAKDSVREGDDSPEFVEAKETSDVQSSASLPRKEETVGHDQPDNEDQSLAVDKTVFESGPLIDFLEILRSRPIGSHFWRRLESQGEGDLTCLTRKLQETLEYERIIRQHMDFELIRTRVDEGYYQSSKTKFFRDLLLLINNAKVFYGERSSEHNSATQLHELIKKHMTLKTSKSDQTSPPKEEPLVTSKEELTLLSLKTKVSVPVKACRKRSSLAVRASTEPLKKKTKVVPTTDEDEKKQVSETEEEDETTDKDEEPIVSKKTPRGRTTTTTSSAKKVGSRNVKTSLDDGSSDQKRNDQEKKGKSTTNAGSKKQSAASFLKRMKGAETVPETVKVDSSSGKKGAEQRRSNTKHEKVDAGQKRATGKKPAKRDSKTEASEKEEGSSTRPKKRTRRS
ncbi:hypothetical protein Bca4012_021684 [Brassica carinata]